MPQLVPLRNRVEKSGIFTDLLGLLIEGAWKGRAVNVVIDIGGRAAIPVRAIPLLTNWETMSPDVVAMALAWDDHFHQFHGLRAYSVENGKVMPAIDATWWENISRRKLNALSGQIKATEVSHEVGYDEWRSKSLPLLPESVFVWKDEFEQRYNLKYGPAGTTFLLPGGGGKMPPTEQARRVKLNFSPFVYDADLRRCVMQGFESFDSDAYAAPANPSGSMFEPFSPLLAGFWETSFEKLPADLKPRVRQYFQLIGWDIGNPAWRQKTVAEMDHQLDPSMAEDSARRSEIGSRISDIERDLRESELSGAPPANSPKFSMTKAAMIAAREHEWPTIRRDFQDASRNGLDAAKAGRRDWNEDDAVAWARSKGKLTSAAIPADSLRSAINSMASLSGRTHELKG